MPADFNTYEEAAKLFRELQQLARTNNVSVIIKLGPQTQSLSMKTDIPALLKLIQECPDTPEMRIIELEPGTEPRLLDQFQVRRCDE